MSSSIVALPLAPSLTPPSLLLPVCLPPLQLGGQTVLCTPSRFLKELPPGLVRFTFLGAKRLANSMKPTTDADFRKLRPGHVRTRRDELLTLADGPASDKVVEKADGLLEEEEGKGRKRAKGKGKEKGGAEGELAAQVSGIGHASRYDFHNRLDSFQRKTRPSDRELTFSHFLLYLYAV